MRKFLCFFFIFSLSISNGLEEAQGSFSQYISDQEWLNPYRPDLNSNTYIIDSYDVKTVNPSSPYRGNSSYSEFSSYNRDRKTSVLLRKLNPLSAVGQLYEAKSGAGSGVQYSGDFSGRVTKAQMEAIGWKSAALTDDFMRDLNSTLEEFGITSKIELCHFIAQVSHECGAGSTLVEKGNGTKDSCTDKFGPHDTYHSKYDNRAVLGNTGHPDGSMYRGGGVIQLTGKDAYLKFQQYTGDLYVYSGKGDKSPAEFVAENYPWRSAAWFWCVYKPGDGFDIRSIAQSPTSTVEQVTKIVQGSATNAIEKRKAYFAKAQEVFVDIDRSGTGFAVSGSARAKIVAYAKGLLEEKTGHGRIGYSMYYHTWKDEGTGPTGEPQGSGIWKSTPLNNDTTIRNRWYKPDGAPNFKFWLDCSSFVTKCYNAGGIKTDGLGTTAEWDKNGEFISEARLQPGDVLNKVGHVGLYVGTLDGYGDRMVIECTGTGYWKSQDSFVTQVKDNYHQIKITSVDTWLSKGYKPMTIRGGIK